MLDIIRKLMKAGNTDAFNSIEELMKAGKELGYSEEELEEALDEFDGFPLEDDEMDEIMGGAGVPGPAKCNSSARYTSGIVKF